MPVDSSVRTVYREAQYVPWNCIRKSFLQAPPSTLRPANGFPEPCSKAPMSP
jgi:hypothetical protein